MITMEELQRAAREAATAAAPPGHPADNWTVEVVNAAERAFRRLCRQHGISPYETNGETSP